MEDKKTYLLQKYGKKKTNVEDYKKYGLFWRPKDSEMFSWMLVCKCDSEEECFEELKWRMEFHETNNIDIAVDNDERLSTFRDETKNVDKNGNMIMPTDADLVQNIDMKKTLLQNLPKPQSGFRTLSYYAGIELNYKGEFIILPVYEIS